MTRKRQVGPRRSDAAGADQSSGNRLLLHLFVARPTPSSARAEANLAALLAGLPDASLFEVKTTDVLQNPHQAVRNRIIVTPCLLLVGSHPPLTLVGDMSDTRALAAFLERAKASLSAG